MKKIGIDIDSVLLDTMEDYLKIYNKKYNTTYTKNDLTVYDTYKILPFINENNFYKIFTEINFRNTELVDENIPNILNKLSKKYEIDLITASGNQSIVDKIINLTKKRCVFNEVKLVDPFNGLKGVFAKEYYVMVDDSPEQIININECGGNVIIYNQPWNRHLKGVRVYDWSQLEELL